GDTPEVSPRLLQVRPQLIGIRAVGYDPSAIETEGDVPALIRAEHFGGDSPTVLREPHQLFAPVVRFHVRTCMPRCSFFPIPPRVRNCDSNLPGARLPPYVVIHPTHLAQEETSCPATFASP